MRCHDLIKIQAHLIAEVLFYSGLMSESWDIAVWYDKEDESQIPHAGIVVTKTESDVQIKSRMGAETDSQVLELPANEVMVRLGHRSPTVLKYYARRNHVTTKN